MRTPTQIIIVKMRDVDHLVKIILSKKFKYMASNYQNFKTIVQMTESLKERST